jgi:hypothetical protein
LDLRIAELTAQIDALPAEIQTLESQLHEFIRAHEERKTRLSVNLKERKDIEMDIKVIQEKIARHKDQLYQVKTNEQYRAMLKEIEGEEANIRKIEDRLLEKMLEAEELEKLIKEAVSRLDSEKARVAAEVARLQSLRQTDVEERERLLAQRQQDEGALSTEVLDLYERVRKARRGVALAEVRDGCCTACNVRLRPQAYNEVRISQAVATCESCNRILYYVEPPPVSIKHITQEEFNEFRRLQRVHRWDWPAVFSTNCHGKIWPFVTRGWTPFADRDDVRGVSSIVDAVANAYLSVRSEGGRFFIDERGAFHKTEDLGAPEVQFVQFQISG